VKIVFYGTAYGTSDVCGPVLRALHASRGFAVPLVVTSPDAPVGRKRQLTESPVGQAARALGLPTVKPEKVRRNPELAAQLRAAGADIGVVVSYGKILPAEVLAIPRLGTVNVHLSLLPRYRGRAPVNWALVHGEKETGLTLHYMVKKPDAGDIVAQRRIEISDEDTALTLYRKLVPLTETILTEAVPLLEDGIAPRVAQDASKATYFGGRKPEDGRIDWTRPSKEIYNLVRAVTHPYPGAFATLAGRKVFIWQSRALEGETQSPPGQIVSTEPLRIACGKGTLEVIRAQNESEEERSGTQWARQLGLKAGQILDSTRRPS
jgi:UDP-4-amino-4-deoxy-L-arabinose formyltransferase/UDP-glucuronic acid dehydrogenase (UDP-4-keto-hexauronic acid decarboxylating)